MKFLFPIILSILFLFGENYKTEYSSTDLVRNDQHVITYECLDKSILFELDLIGDSTNDIKAKWPRKDFFLIWVDYNRNGKVDELIDRAFSPTTSIICKSLLYTKNKHSKCIYDSNILYQERFSATKNSASDHVNFEITIPLNELSESDGANVFFEIIDGSGFKYSYPYIAPLFKSTYNIECNKIT